MIGRLWPANDLLGLFEGARLVGRARVSLVAARALTVVRRHHE